jgi:hypothetical protein
MPPPICRRSSRPQPPSRAVRGRHFPGRRLDKVEATLCLKGGLCHDSTNFISFYAYLFLSFSLPMVRHVTYLVIGSHVGHMMGHLTCHMTWTHDQSRDHGLFISRMSHYDSCLYLSSFPYFMTPTYLISDSCGSSAIYDSY